MSGGADLRLIRPLLLRLRPEEGKMKFSSLSPNQKYQVLAFYIVYDLSQVVSIIELKSVSLILFSLKTTNKYENS